jgi:predicted Zn-dependent protease
MTSQVTKRDPGLAFVREGWEHLRLQRPLAAMASWEQALQLEALNQAASQALQLLRNAPDLPRLARTSFRFRTPQGEALRAAWNHVLGDRITVQVQELSQAAAAFGELTASDDQDAAAWYNRALCLAWAGQNSESIVCLDRVVGLEAVTAPDSATQAWALAEVLRQGAGAEPLADDLDFQAKVSWQAADGDPEALLPELNPAPNLNFPDAGDSPQAGTRTYIWTDRKPAEPSGTLSLDDLPRIVYLSQTTSALVIASPDRSLLNRFLLCLGQVARGRTIEHQVRPLPIGLLDAAIWTYQLPRGLDEPTRRRLLREIVEHQLENVWIHLPRHGLGGLSPLAAARAAAAGDQILKVKLLALVAFREQLEERPKMASLYADYPFDRLRHRLGLPLENPASIDPDDFSCKSLEELSTFDTAALKGPALAEAARSAEGLGDDRLAAQFGSALLERAPESLPASHASGLLAPIVRFSLAERADHRLALEWLDRALVIDARYHEGQNRRTYETWRGEILARYGHPRESSHVYRELLAQSPGDSRLALDAAETLLDNGCASEARPFAEAALKTARASRDVPITNRALALLEALR